jgi:AAA domain
VTSDRHDLDGDGVPWPAEPPPDLDDPAPPARNVRQLRSATTPPVGQGGRGRLLVRDAAEVIAGVDAAGPPSWLVAGLWPADAYGVLAAESKAGKTWAILDLAVSVACGRPWLGRFACPPRPALVFLGEGGERAIVRRLRAVCAHKQLDPATLAGRLRLCFRVPKLRSGEDLAAVEAELHAFPAGLVVVDPLYLAAAGAQAASLFDMGAALEPIQAICQRAGAALVVVHHWNHTGQGTGPSRMSGAGAVEWGRVLGSIAVRNRSVEPDTTASNVLLAAEFVGGEIPEQRFGLRRRVWAEDPDDLASPLHYEASVLDDLPPDPEPERTKGERGRSEVRRAVLAALRAGGPFQTPAQLLQHLSAAGQLAPEPTLRAVQKALTQLAADGLAHGTEEDRGRARYWSATDPAEPGTETDQDGQGAQA